MKHILNNLSEEEKNSIREQHTDTVKIDTSKFTRLMESKLGDVKPMMEQEYDVTPNVMNPKDWYKRFPCLSAKNGVTFGKNGASKGKTIFLAKTGKNDPKYDSVFTGYSPNQNAVGQIQGGGVYFCDSKQPLGLIELK